MSRPILILLTALALAACAHKPAKTENGQPAGSAASKLTLKDDGTAYVTGKVTATQGSCAIGACTLTVAADAREVRVIYGDSLRACPAGTLGPQIVPGQRIKAFGQYARDGEDGIIDVCTGRGGLLEKEKEDMSKP